MRIHLLFNIYDKANLNRSSISTFFFQLWVIYLYHHNQHNYTTLEWLSNEHTLISARSQKISRTAMLPNKHRQSFVNNIHWRWVTNQKRADTQAMLNDSKKMKTTEKAIDFTTYVPLLFWISAKFLSLWYKTWSILSGKIFLLILEEPFSEIGKIKKLPTTSERVAKLRWTDWSKVSRNQHKILVLTYLVTESWFFPLLLFLSKFAGSALLKMIFFSVIYKFN